VRNFRLICVKQYWPTSYDTTRLAGIRGSVQALYCWNLQKLIRMKNSSHRNPWKFCFETRDYVGKHSHHTNYCFNWFSLD